MIPPPESPIETTLSRGTLSLNLMSGWWRESQSIPTPPMLTISSDATSSSISDVDTTIYVLGDQTLSFGQVVLKLNKECNENACG
jgi:hypothetical protein